MARRKNNHMHGIGVVFAVLVVFLGLVGLYYEPLITGNVVLGLDNVTSMSLNGSIILEDGGVFYMDLENVSFTSASFYVSGNATNVSVDVLGDGDYEVSEDMLENMTVFGFEGDLNAYLRNCQAYPCPVPVRVLGEGVVEIRDMQLEYGVLAENFTVVEVKEEKKEIKILDRSKIGRVDKFERKDGKFDLILRRDIERIGQRRESKAEINGLRSGEVNAVFEKVSEKGITTEVFAIDSVSIEDAEITLEKEGEVDFIKKCENFDISSLTCISGWEQTDIEFDDDGETIRFTVTDFTAYAGGVFEAGKTGETVLLLSMDGDESNGYAKFDGTSDSLTIASHDDFSFGDGEFTIEFWFRDDGTMGNDLPLMGRFEVSGKSPFLIHSLPSPRRLVVYLSSDSGTWDLANAVGMGNTPQGEFVHFVMTRSGDDITLWRNGALQNTIELSSGDSLAASSNPLTIIRAWGADPTNMINGSLDELKIYKGRSLTQSEIEARYSEGIKKLDVPDSDLVAYYPFDGDFSDRSYSANTHDGTPSGDTYVSGSHLLTVNGNPKLEDLSKFSQAAYFDGSGDYLNLSDSPDWDFGYDDFTLDMWVRTEDITKSDQAFISRRQSSSGTGYGRWTVAWQTSVGFLFQDGEANVVTSGTTGYASDTWYHLAVVRESGTIKLYVDGVEVDSASYNNDLSSSYSMVIGRFHPDVDNYYHNGYIDEVRVSNISRWSSEFTPSREPYASDSNTVLLLHMDGEEGGISFVDSGNTGHTVEVQGDTHITGMNDSFGSAINLDGNGDYLSVTGSSDFEFDGDFTVDFWMYTNKSSHTDNDVIDFGTDLNTDSRIMFWSTNKLYWFDNNDTDCSLADPNYQLNNTWTHYGFSREGSNFYMYKDGVQVASKSNCNSIQGSSGAITIGRRVDGATYYTGKLDGLRIQKDISINFSDVGVPSSSHVADENTTLLLNFDGDESNSQHSVTFNGNPRMNATEYKFDGSYYFDGSGDYLSIPDSEDWTFGSDDFTIDFWMNPTSLSSTYEMISHYQSGNDYLTIYWLNGNGLGFNVYSSGSPVVTMVQSSTAGWSTNEWYHVAIVRNGDNYTVYRDGSQILSTIDSDNQPDINGPLYIGTYDASGYYFPGYMDELRISKGIALWTSDFSDELPLSPYVDYNQTYNMTVWDEADLEGGSAVRYSNAQIQFYANYTDNNSETITGANCTLNFTDGSYQMSYNSGTYEVSRSFSSAGTYDYTATCSRGGYLTLTANDDVTIAEGVATSSLNVNDVYVYDTLKDNITSPLWKNGGNIGKCAMSFDGDGDYIALPDVSALDFGSGQDFSVGAWIKTDYDSSETHIMGRGDGGNANSFVLRLSGGHVNARVANNAVFTGATTSVSVTDGEWHHVFYTADRDGVGTIYIDGVSDTTNDISSVFSNSIDVVNWVIGAQKASTGTVNAYFDGTIDEVQIFNRALSSTEVSDIYNRGLSNLKSNITDGLVGLWGFDDCIGDNVTDESGNGNIGTVYDAKWKEKASWWKEGNMDEKGVFFDGAGDYVDVANSTDWTFDGNLTMNFWVRTINNSDGCYDTLLATGKWSEAGKINIFQKVTSNVVTVYINGVTHAINGTTRINDGVWHHISLVRADGVLKLYVDGKQDGNSYSYAGTLSGNYARMGFSESCTPGVSETYFTGSIDDVRIYNGKAFSESEIKDIYSRELAGKDTTIYDEDSSLVGYWDFENLTDPYADKSGEGNDGTAYGNTSVSFVDYHVGKPGGVYGPSVVLGGSQDYYNCGSDASLDVGNTFTATAWYKASVLKTYATVLIKHISTHAGSPYTWILSVHDNGSMASYTQTGGGWDFAGTGITANRWYYLTWKVEGGNLYYYINGDLVGSRSFSFTDDSSHNVFIGSLNTNTAYDVSGAIDEVRLYGRALSDNEIHYEYLRGLEHKPSDLDGAVGYWGFNGNSRDETDNSNDCSAVGDTYIDYLDNDIESTPSVSGQAASFYNYLSNDPQGLINVSHHSDLNLNTGAFTIEGWVYSSYNGYYKQNTWDGILGKYTSSTTGWIFGQNKDRLGFWSQNVWGYSNPNVLSPDRWHHVAAVGDSTTLTYYVDGVPAGTNTISIPTTNTGTVQIGGMGHNYWGRMGKMDELRVYTRVLSASEINESYQRGLLHLKSDVDDTGLVAYWSFDGNSEDQSGNSHDGTLGDKVVLYGRGGKKDFPNKTYLVTTEEGLDIIDASDESLWMSSDGEHYASNKWIRSRPSSTVGLNGRLYVGQDDSTFGMLTRFDFPEDELRVIYHASNGYRLYNYDKIKDRNIKWAGFINGYGEVNIIDRGVNDVSIASIDGDTYVAVATDGGASLINESGNSVTHFGNDSQIGTNVDITQVVLLSNGDTYFGHVNTDASNYRVDSYYNLINDTTETAIFEHRDMNYNDLTTPSMTPGLVNDLYVTQGTSTVDSTSNTIYVATDSGVSVIQEKQYDESNGVVVHYLLDDGSTSNSTYKYILGGSSSNCTSVVANGSIMYVGTNDGISVVDTSTNRLVDYYSTTSDTSLVGDKISSFSLGSLIYGTQDSGIGILEELGETLGSLAVEWLEPIMNITVPSREFFLVRQNVTCSGGACGDVQVTLDPQVS